MHLHVVIAFALLIWWSDDRPLDPIVAEPLAVWSIVLTQLVVLSLLGWWASKLALSRLRDGPDGPQLAQSMHHRSMAWLRMGVLAMFAVDLLLTGWCDVVGANDWLAAVPGLTQLAILSPFALGTTLVILTAYPIDRAIRKWVADTAAWEDGARHVVWGLRGYLNFNIRHQLLAALAPMSIILVIYDVTERYETSIESLLPIPWLPDIVLGVSAGGVFVLAPWLLRRIWTTEPLPEGALRDSLNDLCGRIGLRCRNILIWRSGSMFVNAAVMGLYSWVRYVMLSDGLLESMTEKQVEAVFGHEAGHIRHRHIQFFLFFALASMLIASGVMELVYRLSMSPEGVERLSPSVIQAAGLVLILVIWSLGFGFVSRRFERQADLFGARCVSPSQADDCRLPCSVHVDPDTPGGEGRGVCATGAQTFITALDRVACLNGIPLNEPSWRHSSIASRIEHLTALSGDPTRVARFERLIARIKLLLIVVCVVGLAASAYYVWPWFAAEWSRRAAGV